MKNFIFKIFSFLLVPILLGCFVLFYFLYSKKPYSSFKVKDNISSVFIGDSHIGCAIVDSLIPNSQNLAFNSESLYFSYYKLLDILNENQSIKTVYLGFAHHSISSYYDQFLFGDLASNVAPVYYSVLPSSERKKIIYWNSSELIPFTKKLIEEKLRQLVKSNYYPCVTGFSNKFGNKGAVKSSMNKRIRFQYYKNDRVNDYSEINITHLSKIVDLCTERKVKLITISTPVNEYYYNNIPSKYRMKFDKIINDFKLDHRDFSKLSSTDKCNF